MTTTQTTPDLDAIEADAQMRVEQLREQQRRISPEALVDGGVKQKLLSVESELQDAERAAGLVPLAQREIARREQEAEGQAVRENRGRIEAEIAKCDAQAHALAAEADAKLAEAFAVLQQYDALYARRNSAEYELHCASGNRSSYSGRRLTQALEAALLFHSGEAGMPRILTFEAAPGRVLEPLAAREPAPPAKGGK